jgi:hypothetical protein
MTITKRCVKSGCPFFWGLGRVNFTNPFICFFTLLKRIVMVDITGISMIIIVLIIGILDAYIDIKIFG